VTKKQTPRPLLRGRIDGERVQAATHNLINWLDDQRLTEAEKLCVLLAATFTQEQYMGQEIIEFVKAIHAERLEELRKQ